MVTLAVANYNASTMFKAGQSGNPEGRKPGTVNRRTQEAAELAERLGVNPLEILLLFAKGDWKALGYDSPDRVRMVNDTIITEPIISAELRSTSASKAVEYIYAKKKAVDVTTLGESIKPPNVIQLHGEPPDSTQG